MSTTSSAHAIPSFSTKVTAFALYALACAVACGITFGVFAGVTIATARAIMRWFA